MDNNDVGNAIVTQINNVLTTIDQEEAAIGTKIAELKAQGYRIVNWTGLQSDPVRDWRTNEIVGPYPGHDQWPENWYHIDPVTDEAAENIETLKVPTLSAELADSIKWLVDENEDEFRALLGRPTNATERGRPK